MDMKDLATMRGRFNKFYHRGCSGPSVAIRRYAAQWTLSRSRRMIYYGYGRNYDTLYTRRVTTPTPGWARDGRGHVLTHAYVSLQPLALRKALRPCAATPSTKKKRKCKHALPPLPPSPNLHETLQIPRRANQNILSSTNRMCPRRPTSPAAARPCRRTLLVAAAASAGQCYRRIPWRAHGGRYRTG